MNELSKTLIFLGMVLVVAGLFLAFLGKVPGMGRLPGDITFRKGSFTFYFPLATCLLVSLLLTLIFSLFGKK